MTNQVAPRRGAMIRYVLGQLFVLHAIMSVMMAGPFVGELVGQAAPATNDNEVDLHFTDDGAMTPKVIRAGGRAGIAAYPDGRWAITAVIVGNPSTKPIEVEATAYFRAAPQQQYSRRLWIPPRAVRRTGIPMLVPRLTDGSHRRETVVIVRDLATGEVVRNSLGRRENTLPLSKPIDPFISTVLLDSLLPPGPSKLPTDGDVMQAMRFALRKKVQLTHVPTIDFPQSYLEFEALNQIAISNDAIQRDAAAAAGLREWIRLGGEAWLMLDLIEEATAAAIWNGNLPFETIDNVTLTAFELSKYDVLGNRSSRHIDVEEPIDFVRVIVDPGVEVTHFIDDWPASFVVPFGEGRILVTTLGAAAWVMSPLDYKRPNQGRRQTGPVVDPPYFPHDELVSLGAELNVLRSKPAVTSIDFQSYLQERIGYEVVPWQSVAIVLSAFVVSLLAVGLVLYRFERMGYMLGIAPAAVAITTAALLALGESSDREVPETVGAIQWIKVFPGSREAVIDGELAFFNPSRSKFKVGADGGMFRLDMSGQAGVKRTMRWSSNARWEWDDLTIPKGLRFATWRRPIHYDKPPVAHAEFGDFSFAGQLRHSPWETLEDAILLFPNRRPVAVNFEDDGSFTIDAEVSLGREQFVQGTLLSDEQGRRQRLLKEMHARRLESGFPSRPMLLAWSDVAPEGIIANEDARHFHTSLISLPIEFHRPEPGTSVELGPSFLRLAVVHSPFGDGVSPVYRAASDEWVDLTVPANAWLRFQMPPELLPFTVESATVNVELNVPSRTVNFRSVHEGTAIELREESSPSGSYSFDLQPGTDFEVDEQGGILFNIQISPADTDDDRKPQWKINDARMSVVGRIPEDVEPSTN